MYRAAGALPSDVAAKVQELGNEAAHNPELKDGKIALDSAEQSALRQLEKIRQKKEVLASKEIKVAPSIPTVPEMSETPGRKTRKGNQPSEELEYETRTDPSWSVMSSPNSPSPPQ